MAKKDGKVKIFKQVNINKKIPKNIGFDGLLSIIKDLKERAVKRQLTDIRIILDDNQLSVEGYIERLETDAEYRRRKENERIAKERKEFKKKQKEHKEHMLYLRLKKKFEGA